MEITQSEKQTVGNNQSGNRQWEITQIVEIVGITPRVETDSGDYLKCGNRQWGLPRACNSGKTPRVWKQTVGITQSVETDSRDYPERGNRQWGLITQSVETDSGDYPERGNRQTVGRHRRHRECNRTKRLEWGEDNKVSVFRHVAGEFSVLINYS